MFDIRIRVKCPYCGKADEAYMANIEFGHTMRVVECGHCGRRYGANLDASISITAQKFLDE